jgi:hypothetical protein
MKDPDVRPKRVCSPKYAVIKARKGKKLNRWEIEEIAKDAEQSLHYSLKVLHGRFPEGEAAIAQHAEIAFDYAKNVIRGRFPEAEDTFLKSNCDWGTRNYLQRYFIDIAQCPNKKIEKKILETHHGLAVDYAERCIRGRWPEAEGVILKDINNAISYHSKVVKERWSELEDRIIRKKKDLWVSGSEVLSKYMKNVGRPIPELENKLEKCSRASLLLVYAVKGIRGKLPGPLHQKMMMFSFDPKKQKVVRKYIRFIEECEQRVMAYIAGLDDGGRKELLSKIA